MYAIGVIPISEAPPRSQRTGLRGTMRGRAAALLIFCAFLAAAPVAHADPEYTDEDSDYLKVTSFFLEPVGRILEWVVFRPIHRYHHFVDPYGRVDSTSKRVCTGLRPRRECGLQH